MTKEISDRTEGTERDPVKILDDELKNQVYVAHAKKDMTRIVVAEAAWGGLRYAGYDIIGTWDK